MPQIFPMADYAIHLGPLIETLPAWLQQRNYSRIFVICDQHTRQHCLPVLAVIRSPVKGDPTATLPAGETFKTLATCEQVWQAMLEAQLDRQALVINLGGGVIGDLGGFCAATWKRGVDFIQIPTTLLSMTDAAIGGKLGVDFQDIKNTIGVFQNPAAVFVDPVFLQTLPEREL
ncbi:MAG: iron-containing alcohol dehydrogenase, partial [Saprospiraceae bacterium]